MKRLFRVAAMTGVWLLAGAGQRASAQGASAQGAAESERILAAHGAAGCEDAALHADGSIRVGTRTLGRLSADERNGLRRRAAHRSAALVVSGSGTCLVMLSLPRPRGMDGREPVTEMWMVSPSAVEHVGRLRAFLDSHASLDSQRVVGFRIDNHGSLSFQEVESGRASCERRADTTQRFAERHWRFYSKSPGEALTHGDEEPDGMWVDCLERRRNPIAGAARAREAHRTSQDGGPAPVPTIVVRTRVVMAPGEPAADVVLWSSGRIQVGALESEVDFSLARLPALDGTEVDLSRVFRISTRCFTNDQNLLWISMSLQDQYEEDSFGRNVALTKDGGRLSVVFSEDSHGASWMTMESLGFRTQCGVGEVSRLRIGARTFDSSGRVTRAEDHDWDEAIFSPVEREVYRRRRGGPLRLVEVRRTGFVFDRRSFAACPHVYVERDGEFSMSGEILRHMVGREAYGDQGLTLGGFQGGLLRIELREEQHEVTHLDEVHLEVDGRPIVARECATTPVPAFCEQDDREHVMRHGDVLRLHFDVPAGRAELRATGYYNAH